MNRWTMAIALLCLVFAGSGEAQESLPVNQQPMYGGVEKTEAMKEADEQFLSRVAGMGYTREAGSRKSVDLGWRYLFDGDATSAMTRFNQAWLQNPENGDAYHGFAVVTAQRGGPPEEVEKYFKLAAAKPGVGATALVDYARFLNMLGRHDEAIAQGRNALAVSPAARNARIQISYAYISLEDAAQACDWGRQARDNGDHIEPPDYLATVCNAPSP